jgi:peptidyl-prolyl cis-trans isomerase SurA
LDSAWNMMEQRLGLSKGQLVGFLKENNIPERLIKEQVLASYGWQRYVHERYGKDVRVEDTEVKAEMAKLQKNKEKNQALLSEIVLNYSTPEQAEEAKRKATEVSAKIKSGTPFPLLAQQYSHSASAARGGDIGWVSIDEMDPEVKKAVQSTRRGEITSPVATQSGYRIFGIRDRHGVGSLGDSVEYVSFLQIDFQFPMFGGEEGQEETFIKANNIREEARTRSMMLKLTEGRPRIKTQNIENIQLDSLHPELIKVLSKLKPGDRSPLMNTGEGVIMFMMCDKKTVKPHEPTEEEIKNKLRETKFDAINSRELRALRREAFIEMR